MEVGIFVRTTSVRREKQDYMYAFAEGVVKNGDKVKVIETYRYEPCDLALIFGFYGRNLSKVHAFRKQVYENHHIKREKMCVFLDADLLRFAGKIKASRADDPTQHLRVSCRSIYPNDAYYFNENSPNDRWELLKARKKIQVQPYRHDGEHILICLNSDTSSGRGWSAKDIDMIPWTFKKLKHLRKITSRPIRVRFHPNAKEDVQRNLPWKEMSKIGDITFSGGIMGDSPLIINDHNDLIDDCKNAWATVVYNTSASVIPIIQGIPVFTSEPTCITYPIANHTTEHIDNPKMISREQWFYDLAYSCWNQEEMRAGIVWNRIRSRLNDRGDYSRERARRLNIRR